jgi:hypothetical protein
VGVTRPDPMGLSGWAPVRNSLLRMERRVGFGEFRFDAP